MNLVRRPFAAWGVNLRWCRAALGRRPALDPPWAARPSWLAQPRAVDPHGMRGPLPKPPSPRGISQPCLSTPHAPRTSHSEKPLIFGKVSRPATHRAPLLAKRSGPNAGGPGLRGVCWGHGKGPGRALLLPLPRGRSAAANSFRGQALCKEVVWVFQDTALYLLACGAKSLLPLKIRDSLIVIMSSPVPMSLVELSARGTPESPSHPFVASEFASRMLHRLGRSGIVACSLSVREKNRFCEAGKWG